jgi:hypothetical protein
MDGELVPRIGTFFLLVGTALMLIFIGSVLGHGTNLLYLLFGIVAIFMGAIFRRRAAPPPANTRFHSVRRARDYSRTRRQEREAGKHKDKEKEKK